MIHEVCDALECAASSSLGVVQGLGRGRFRIYARGLRLLKTWRLWMKVLLLWDLSNSGSCASADVGIVKAFQIFGSEIPAKFHIDHVISTWRPVVLGLRLSMPPAIPQTGLRGFPPSTRRVSDPVESYSIF